LTPDDITRPADGQVLIRFGEPPTPVPEPFATLLLQATTQRDNLQTATNPSARWLFPGRRAGQPLHASHLSELVRDLGVLALAGRTAALRQLVLQVPAPVVAQVLGYHHNTHHPDRHRGRNAPEPLPGFVGQNRHHAALSGPQVTQTTKLNSLAR
jgi:hypothetical protein